MCKLLVFLAPLIFFSTATAQVTPTSELQFDKAGYQAMLQYRRAISPAAAGFALPTLRAYNSDGEEVLSVRGFERDGFADTLKVAAHPNRRSTPAFTLDAELESARDYENNAVDLDALLADDLTIVEYWSEWCVPCHAQAKAVAAFVASHPDLDVSWIKVEADLAAFHEEATGDQVHVLGRTKRSSGQ